MTNPNIREWDLACTRYW